MVHDFLKAPNSRGLALGACTSNLLRLRKDYDSGMPCSYLKRIKKNFSRIVSIGYNVVHVLDLNILVTFAARLLVLRGTGRVQ